MSACRRRLFSDSCTASARSCAPCINCQSVNGIDGTVVFTRRATTFALAQDESMAATRDAGAHRHDLGCTIRAEGDCFHVELIGVFGCASQKHG